MNLLLMRFLNARSFCVLDMESLVHPAIYNDKVWLLTVGSVIGRSSSNEGRAVLKRIPNVEVDVIRH